MAVITPGPLIGDIRGSVNAITFARNKSAMIVRPKPYPKRSKSARQTNRAASWARARSLWLDLTSYQRLAWLNAAEVANGLARRPWGGTLTAFQYFCLVKGTRAMENYADASGPPILYTPSPIILAIPIARWNSYFQITIVSANPIPTARVSVFGASPNVKAANNYSNQHQWKFIGDYAYNTFPRDILDDWKLAFGQPQNLQNGSVRLIVQALNCLPSLPTQWNFYWGTA